MDLNSVWGRFPRWKNARKNVYGVQCLFTAQMIMVKQDAMKQVANVFVKVLLQLSTLVIKSITRVIDFINTKLQVT